MLTRLAAMDGGNILLDDLARGGYRLMYNDSPSRYEQIAEHRDGGLDLRYSLGISVTAEGKIDQVLWNGEGFKAGLTPGARILRVGNQPFSISILREAVAGTLDSKAGVDLSVTFGQSQEKIHVDYEKGLRYPHLERIETIPNRLNLILDPLL